jgi:hypothetical protein
MSHVGQKRKSARLNGMSASPPEADIARRTLHVRKVPIGDFERAGRSKEKPSEGGSSIHPMIANQAAIKAGLLFGQTREISR